MNGSKLGGKPDKGALLSVRTVVILLLALLPTAAATTLIALTTHSAAELAMAGMPVLAGGIRFFDWLIE